MGEGFLKDYLRVEGSVKVKTNKIRFWIVFSVLVVIVLGFFFWRKIDYSPIPSVGGGALNLRPIAEAPFYLQRDPRWKDIIIGGSGESIGNVGCTLSSLAMAIDHYGVHLTPLELNEQLKGVNGFTQDGLIQWSAVSKLTNSKIWVDVSLAPTHENIDQALQLGQPVLTKIMFYGTIPHWVLIVGKAGQEYLIKDPLGEGVVLEKLSKFESSIYAIRVVKKA